MTGPFVAFHSHLFRDQQPDEELDQWFLGEDLANWLHKTLTQHPEIESECAPLEEDWHGWTFGLRVRGISFWINIWNAGRENWIVGLELRPGLLGLFRKARAATATVELRGIVTQMLATPDFRDVAWSDRWPSARVQSK
jgi:hypothetical protein